jgi:hypothetical protein
VQHFEVRWLSTRCRTGDAEEARRAFCLVGPNVIKHIGAAKWGRCKTEAIDRTRSDWYWIDNSPDEEDLALLRQRGLLDHLIIVEDGDAGALERARQRLEGIVPSG